MRKYLPNRASSRAGHSLSPTVAEDNATPLRFVAECEKTKLFN